ncbi:MAG: hypothetical protein P4L99_08935 [Chthoniobacter sp.]|nr:hypothetical protein [Chthoniobacter sp.]
MNTARRLVFLLLASLVASVTTGCTTLQPLHSKPPLAKIILPQPFDGDGFMFHLHMPAGEYLPLYEQGTTYYYQAPSKIAIRTIATDYQDGGFFVEAGTKVPHGWWHFDDEGNKTDGYLGTPLAVVYKAIP